MMKAWIDFKELRANLDTESVLTHYGVEIKKKGDQHMGFCPLPGHGGSRKSPSFSVNLAKGIFHCFGCQAKGNILDFAALMEKIDPKDGVALRKVALGLQERFCPETAKAPTKNARPAEKEEPEQPELPIVTNAELDFELQGLDPDHPYLLGRGFTKETITHFGLGFCSRGSLKDRVAIPLHDTDGCLVGYAGRVVDDTEITDENPRYRLPSKREREGTTFDFKKTKFLYNGFRFKTPRTNLGVVEGFPSVWWLHQHGYPNAVATMGAECSEEQAELIVSLVRPDGHVWLIPDGDKAGVRFASTLFALIAPHRFVRWVMLGDGKQPTDLSAEEMAAAFRT